VLDLSGGAGVLIHERFGAGGELRLETGGGDGWLLVGLTGSVHIRRPHRDFDPFITAGHGHTAFLTEPGGTNEWNLGGGFINWGGRKGLLLDFREMRYQSGQNQWVVRIGLAFR
jgi:hypothetical protein